MPEAKLQLSGLSDLEVLDLEQSLGAGLVQRQARERGKYEAGALEPISATVILTGMAIQALAAWLLKNRKRQRFRQQVNVEYPDGRKETRDIDIDLSEEEAKENVVKALLQQLKLPTIT